MYYFSYYYIAFFWTVSGDAWRTRNNANYRLVCVNAKQRHSFIRFQHLGSEHLLIFGPEWILKIMMYFFSPLEISTEGMPTNSSNKPNIRGVTQVALLTPELSSLLLFVWNKPSNRRCEVTVGDKLQWSTIVFDTAWINILCCCFFPKCVVIFFPFCHLLFLWSPQTDLTNDEWASETLWPTHTDCLSRAAAVLKRLGVKRNATLETNAWSLWQLTALMAEGFFRGCSGSNPGKFPVEWRTRGSVHAQS